MKSFLLTALKSGLPFGGIMGLFYGDAIMGVVAGLVFGCSVAGLLAWLKKRSVKLLAQYADEGILYDGPANHGSTGGWLILTKQRLVFHPHKLNLSSRVIEIAATDIAGARKGDSVVPNTIAVGTRANQTVQFRVNKRGVWLAKLPGVKM